MEKGKDFSIELPSLIEQLKFVGLGLQEPLLMDGMFQATVAGVGSMILNITDQLQGINTSLYGN